MAHERLFGAGRSRFELVLLFFVLVVEHRGFVERNLPVEYLDDAFLVARLGTGADQESRNRIAPEIGALPRLRNEAVDSEHESAAVEQRGAMSLQSACQRG